MSKFISFLVFLFGITLLVVTLFTMGQRFLAPEPEAAPKVTRPMSNLPALQLGTLEQFHAKLDGLYNEQRLDGVRDYIAKEFVPGRTIILSANSVDESDKAWLILDREVRQSLRDGGVLMEKAPVLTRANATLQVDDDVQLKTWPRLGGLQPFTVTVWGMAAPNSTR